MLNKEEIKRRTRELGHLDVEVEVGGLDGWQAIELVRSSLELPEKWIVSARRSGRHYTCRVTAVSGRE